MDLRNHSSYTCPRSWPTCPHGPLSRVVGSLCWYDWRDWGGRALCLWERKHRIIQIFWPSLSTELFHSLSPPENIKYLTYINNIMPKLSQEKWLLQYEGVGMCGESQTHSFSSKQEAIERMQILATNHDIITVSLKRVFNCSDQDGLVNNIRKRDKPYHASPSSPQHASDHLDAIELEEIDLDEIPLDDIVMDELPPLDWQEVCCSFLKQIITPKKKGLIIDFPNHHDRGCSPITHHLFLRRGE